MVEKIKTLSNIKYYSMQGNKGIAAALNKGVHMAYKDGFDYLLTMDQDSKFNEGILNKYVKEAEKQFGMDEKIILCGINHIS